MPVQLPFSFNELPSVPVDPGGTVILVLTRSRLGEQRSLRKALQLDASLEGQVDKRILSMMARLYGSPELKAIETLDSTVTARLARTALPSILRNGSTWILPLPLIPTVDTFLSEAADTRNALVTALSRVFDDRVKETQKALGPLATSFTWMTAEQVRSCFAMTWRYYSIGLPSALESFDPLLYEREKARMMNDLADQAALIRKALAESALRLLARLENNLTPNENGRTRITESSLEAIRSFLSLLPARQVVPDPEFTALMRQAETLLGPVSTADLRKNPFLRAGILDTITTVVDALVETTGLPRPSRRISLTDDDDVAAPVFTQAEVDAITENAIDVVENPLPVATLIEVEGPLLDPIVESDDSLEEENFDRIVAIIDGDE